MPIADLMGGGDVGWPKEIGESRCVYTPYHPSDSCNMLESTPDHGCSTETIVTEIIQQWHLSFWVNSYPAARPRLFGVRLAFIWRSFLFNTVSHHWKTNLIFEFFKSVEAQS